ncbi:MAG: hypothetical protein ACFB0B_06380 [Thermonemataceae bacterium]
MRYRLLLILCLLSAIGVFSSKAQNQGADPYKQLEQKAVDLLGKNYNLSKSFRFTLQKNDDNAMAHRQYIFSKTSNYAIAFAGDANKEDMVQIMVYDANNELVAKNINNSLILRFTPPKGGIYRITFQSNLDTDINAVGVVGFAAKGQ